MLLTLQTVIENSFLEREFNVFYFSDLLLDNRKKNVDNFIYISYRPNKAKDLPQLNLGNNVITQNQAGNYPKNGARQEWL